MKLSIWIWIAVFASIPVVLKLVDAWLEERRFAKAGLQDLKRMGWRDFEKYLAHLFRGLGYHVELTPPSGDNGVDVILTHPNGRRIAVQAKRWTGKKVGSPEVQKTVGGAQYYRCDESIVVTTSGYTEQAREFARQTGTKLWGLKELGDAMAQVQSGAVVAQIASTSVAGTSQKVPATTSTAGLRPGSSTATNGPARVAATTVAPKSPACPQCGRSMVKKLAMQREIWVCSTFPQCRGSRA